MFFHFKNKTARLNGLERCKSKKGFIVVYCSFFTDFWPSRFLSWGCNSFFRVSEGSAFSYGQWGDSFVRGESQLGISLGGLQYQFLAQLANAGPKSVKVNLTDCHREVCKVKFYQIVTSDVLTSLWQFDKMLF